MYNKTSKPFKGNPIKDLTEKKKSLGNRWINNTGIKRVQEFEKIDINKFKNIKLKL